MSEFERKMIEKISSLENITFWHRNESRKGFAINGWKNHYPDFIIMTESGRIILIETK
jgi:type III restriction enzyme